MCSSGATRRSLLRAAGLTAVGGLSALAGCTGDAQSGDSTERFDGYLANVDDAEEVRDRTDAESVSITVGAQGNGGNLAYAPAAVRVAADTTVTWEWTGAGGSHNVVHEGGAFESTLVTDADHTFTHTFETAGTFRYYCTPHKGLGMRGVVVVEG